MRKLYLVIGTLALLAASCNTTTPPATQRQTTPPPAMQNSSSQTNVDSLVTELNASLDSEEAISFESDEDIVSSDSGVVSGYEGVSNVNY